MIILRGGVTQCDLNVDTVVELTQRLMAEDKIIANFIVPDPLDIAVDDYIVYNGVNYTINRTPKVQKIAAVQFNYNIEFESPAYRLLDKIFMLYEQAEFPLVGTLNDFMDLFLTNINSIDAGWTLGVNDTTAQTNEFPPGTPFPFRKLIQFRNNSCREVLNILSTNFLCEFSITDKVIRFSDMITNVVDLPTFEHGKAAGLYNLTRMPVDAGNTITRAWGYGSTRNLPVGYGNLYANFVPRLQFTTGSPPVHYIDDQSDYARVVEKAVFFEEIYPRLEQLITGVSGDGLSFVASGMSFNVNDWLMPLRPAQVIFLSGDLMGYQFEMVSYDPLTYTVKIKPSDTTGATLPTSIFHCNPGDLFTFVDVQMATAYVTQAEELLRRMTVLWLSFFSKLRVKYALTLDYRYVRDYDSGAGMTFAIGDLITINDADLGIVNKELRINYINLNLAKTKIQIEISNYRDEWWENALTKNLANTINQMMAQITNNIVINNGGDGSQDLRTILISGVVTPDNGLTYWSTQLVYKILGVDYTSPPQAFTIADGDATFPRIDVVYVDQLGQLHVLQGTPAANPVKPTVASNQLEVTNILVPAGATSASFSADMIYDENAQQPTEWDTASTLDTGITCNFADTVLPYWHDKNIKVAIGVPDSAVPNVTHHLGDDYGGGVIFALDNLAGTSGFIAYPQPLAATVFELFDGTTPYDIGTTLMTVGAGDANTDLILANNNAKLHIGAAIKFFNDSNGGGHNDWFIGSINEMQQLQFRKNVPVGGILKFVSLTGTFWSSSQNAWDSAFCIVMETGYSPTRIKTNQYKIVPVRSFDDSGLPAGNPVTDFTPSSSLDFTTATPIEVADAVVNFMLKTSKPWGDNTTLLVQLMNGSTVKGSASITKTSSNYGFNDALTNWQTISIPAWALNLVSGEVNHLKISFVDTWPNNMQINIDRVRILHDETQAVQWIEVRDYHFYEEYDGERDTFHMLQLREFQPGSVRLTRNGVRQNIGATNDFIELDGIQVQLAVPAEPDEVFIIEYRTKAK